ncbi:hypothetical protein [Streptosporangium sp. NPDC000396]|uniref:hypothetical protein n=1 Tax=Streptosporangium sp. NPDC000396 TaxID=3366185 RepID=UPI003679471D
MNVTRETWVSAAIVGAVLAGGISVTAAATAGKGGDPAPGVLRETSRSASENLPASPDKTPPPDSNVVSEDLNPNPKQIVGYWTKDRMKKAEPYPMPMIEGPVDVTE